MDPLRLTRRALLKLAGGALGAPLTTALGSAGTIFGAMATAACGGSASERLMPSPSAARGDASSGRASPPPRRAPPGTHNLGLGGERDGVLVVPEGPDPAPLILMLHGAGGSGRRAARLIGPAAAELGCAVLAPDSRDRTWDAVTGAFGPDVRFLERALAVAAERCDLAPGRSAVAGFSDGATYALALGRANGDRFSHVLAFSPGFLIPARRVGTPRLFVSHGRQDDVLPIDSCSRVMVPRLRGDGYEVQYREFEGGHEAPAGVVREGVGLFVGVGS
jgi:predicted esterase